MFSKSISDTEDEIYTLGRCDHMLHTRRCRNVTMLRPPWNTSWGWPRYRGPRSRHLSLVCILQTRLHFKRTVNLQRGASSPTGHLNLNGLWALRCEFEITCSSPEAPETFKSLVFRVISICLFLSRAGCEELHSPWINIIYLIYMYFHSPRAVTWATKTNKAINTPKQGLTLSETTAFGDA